MKNFFRKVFVLVVLGVIFAVPAISESWYICVGSFKKGSNAQALVKTLEQNGVKSDVDSYTKDGVLYYRVLLTEPFEKYNDAQKKWDSIKGQKVFKSQKITSAWICKGSKEFEAGIKKGSSSVGGASAAGGTPAVGGTSASGAASSSGKTSAGAGTSTAGKTSTSGSSREPIKIELKEGAGDGTVSSSKSSAATNITEKNTISIPAATEEQVKAAEKAAEEARIKAEKEARAKEEARIKAEEEAHAKAEAKAKEEALLKARAEAKAKADAESKARAEEEALREAQLAKEAREKEEAEIRARIEAKVKADAEAKAKAEAEAKARAEEQARAEAEAKARAEEARRKADSVVASSVAADKAGASTPIGSLYRSSAEDDMEEPEDPYAALESATMLKEKARAIEMQAKAASLAHKASAMELKELYDNVSEVNDASGEIGAGGKTDVAGKKDVGGKTDVAAKTETAGKTDVAVKTDAAAKTETAAGTDTPVATETAGKSEISEESKPASEPEMTLEELLAMLNQGKSIAAPSRKNHEPEILDDVIDVMETGKLNDIPESQFLSTNEDDMPLSSAKPYSVLVRSYKDEHVAKSDRRRLEERGICSYLVKTFDDEHYFSFNIHAGAYSTPEEAEPLVEKLREIGIADTEVVDYRDFASGIQEYESLLAEHTVTSDEGTYEIPEDFSPYIKSVLSKIPVHRNFHLESLQIFDLDCIREKEVSCDLLDAQDSLFVDMSASHAAAVAYFKDMLYGKRVSVFLELGDSGSMDVLESSRNGQVQFVCRSELYTANVTETENGYYLKGRNSDYSTAIIMLFENFTESNLDSYLSHVNTISTLVDYSQVVRRTLLVLPEDKTGVSRDLLYFTLNQVTDNYAYTKGYAKWAVPLVGHWEASSMMYQNGSEVSISFFDLDYDYIADEIHNLFVEEKSDADTTANHFTPLKYAGAWYLDLRGSNELSFFTKSYVVAVNSYYGNKLSENELKDLAEDLKIW